MQERFEKQAAIRAMRLFKSFIRHSDLKEKINGSNRTLVILAVLAYFGDCSKTKLYKAIPVSSMDAAIEELISLGYINKKKDGKEVRYMIAEHPDFVAENIEYSYESAFLFANALMNINLWFKNYRITSWNTITLMLEVALKYEFTKGTVELTDKTIDSIVGNLANVLSTRKAIERMGVIKCTHVRSGRSVGSEFKVNRRAYIIEAK